MDWKKQINKVIWVFSGEYEFLSNFYKCEIRDTSIDISKTGRDMIYPSTENYYQAQKCRSDAIVMKEPFMNCTPGQAKKLGRKVILRSDWEDVKISVMWDALMLKFTQHKHLREKLLDTQFKILIEGNNWGDHFWGADINTLYGENWLGILLMDLRSKLRLEETFRKNVGEVYKW